MSYAIISVGGKQYRVRAGQRLLVDRVAAADGETITPAVLLVGGDGETQVAPEGVTVTARVLGQQRGPKIRIGKYKQRVGYKRHTGFRAALTQIEIESIGAGQARPAKGRSEQPRPEPSEPAEAPAASGDVPPGYADLTVAELRAAAGGWEADALRSALAYERAHGQRKGAISALEAALAAKEGE